jgi:phosphatidylserine/phosphatidylglycerophosphate/cardiolipin synthase-like enzyme
MKTLLDRSIYEDFTRTHLTRARRFIWIATANIKATGLLLGNTFVSFPDFMAIMVNRGINFRIIHAELPSGPFRERYERLDEKGGLSSGVEFLHCIRMHSKIFIVDGIAALVGSPNLTGAGIGAKSAKKRNFEIAFLFEGDETSLFVEYFDQLWMGARCAVCGLRNVCPAPAS